MGHPTIFLITSNSPHYLTCMAIGYILTPSTFLADFDNDHHASNIYDAGFISKRKELNVPSSPLRYGREIVEFKFVFFLKKKSTRAAAAPLSALLKSDTYEPQGV